MGYERNDGLWDIEGRITDIKSYSFDNHDRGEVNAGTPVHEMCVRLTIDSDLIVHKAEASTEFAPFNNCPSITGGIKALKGLKIASGWRRNVQQFIGGIKGCTHINELLMGPLATTAYQTIIPRKSSSNSKMSTKLKRKSNRPETIDTCYALASDGINVKRLWPDFFKDKKESND